MKYPQLVSMPSAVSDWLEEQLEARGIDAVVYTRYILSLLHSHPVDVIHPDDDLHFSRLKKEVKRQSRGRKRFRGSTSNWWRHAQAKAEQIKRSAAVECLMSASDQNCEIESLVDELCQKLKEIKSAPASPLPFLATETRNLKISPQELAEKYYAAFPPLRPKSPDQQTAALVSLVPKWRHETSLLKQEEQKKSNTAPIGGCEQTFRAKVDNDKMKARTQNKQRLSYLIRTKNNPQQKNENLSTDWELNMYNNRKINNLKHRKLYKRETPLKNSWDQCIPDVWTNSNDDNLNMYDDLPVDIQFLLDSPDPHEAETVEMMNIANMKDDGKRAFIPYGTNIMSSIWSTDQEIMSDNTFNTIMDSKNSLDLQFNAFNIKPSTSGWPEYQDPAISDNEANKMFEAAAASAANKSSAFLEGFKSLPIDWNKTVTAGEDDDELKKYLNVSLMKLNHDKEASCFVEVAPKSICNQSRSFNQLVQTDMFGLDPRHSLGVEREKEDLLTSEKSHFKPIDEKREHQGQGQYADGTTFIISNSLDKVDYRRSKSGSMWLDIGFSQSKKYFEYKVEGSESQPDLKKEFVLKFNVCQNDKACQTEKESAISFAKPDVKVWEFTL